MTDFSDLQDFGRRSPEEFAKVGVALGKAAKREIARRMVPLARAITPVGGVLSRDRHPGLMKRSWKTLLAGAGDGPASIGNEAPYAAVIDRGRKRGFTKRGEKRVRFRKGEKKKPNKEAPMLGSKQAPKGISAEAFRQIEAQHDQILEVASREAERE